ncbi:MAG: hypothetical protein AAFV43_11985 [Planctomycetota bacterium]
MNPYAIGVAAFAVSLMLPDRSGGHGVPVLVTTTADGTGLAVGGAIPVGELIDDGFEVFAEDPGLGVGFASGGPPTGTRIGIEAVGPLLYGKATRLHRPTRPL